MSNKPEVTAVETGAKLRVTLVKSPTKYSERHKRTVRALGLRRMHQTVEHVDGPVARGMIAKVAFLVAVEEVK
ncbi:MAG: 50S ribosomal protein L30 [Thermoflexales bacterium]|nr:50S ribosomal protein L30 [Thermoflexales bacterium]